MKDIAPDFPAVLHGDVAGVIEVVGEGVNAFKPGEEVYACAGGVKGLGGALAEFLRHEWERIKSPQLPAQSRFALTRLVH